MASCEETEMSLEDMDLEAFEIDENLLRELLQEEESNGGDVRGNKESIVESMEESNKNIPNTTDEKQEEQGQQHNILEQYECHYAHDFEWLNKMELMEPTNTLDDVMTMNWFSDDTVGKLDFGLGLGYANGECYPQICDGVFTSDESYGCLWGDY